MRISIYLIIILSCFTSFAGAKKIHNVFFEGTDYELNVYRVYGKEPGKTILLIGGIQGDEPGGFLSADSYADMSLLRGNLIVVPRANFHSIVLNKRQVNEDMNRKFAEDNWVNYETKVVAILKDLIAESDCLLNLHDGSGFYSDKWESDQRNPKRYGQSIISDYEVYELNDEKKTKLMLGEMGREIVEKINEKIQRKDYLFHFNNHDTDSKSSIHKVQKKSATYYALTKCGIPAYGVETSKSLPLELKIRHHVFAINAFMEKFDVVPEFPAINLDKPELKYIVLSVNNSLPVVVKAGQTLSINPDDSIEIMHIEANYERGLSADIVGLGSVNDVGRSISINKPTRITIKKDYYPCGDVYISLSGGGVSGNGQNYTVLEKKGGSFLIYKIKVDGVSSIVDNYGEVQLTSGDIFEIEDVVSTEWDSSAFVVNFKGYVGNSSANTGEDRGFKINTAKDLWPNYSLNKKGVKYQIVVSNKSAVLGKLFVVVNPPFLNYLIVKNNRGLQCIKNGGTINFKSQNKENTIEIVEIISNVVKRTGVDVELSGGDKNRRVLKIGKPVEISEAGMNGPFTRLNVLRYGKMMGSVSVNYLPENEIRRTVQDEQI